MLRIARTVFRKELRETLRDPLVLINAVGFPLLLLPLILWGATQFALLQAGVAERAPPRVALVGDAPAALIETLLAEPVERVDPPTEPAADALRSGALDAVVAITRDGEATTVAIEHDSTRQRSSRARRLLAERVDTARGQRLLELAEARGLAPEELAPTPIDREDVSEDNEKWGEILGEMLPIMIFTALLMAVVFPAVDTVAGERERGTVETTLVTAIDPVQVALGKVATVVAIGFLAMAGNAVAVGLTVVQFLLTLKEGSADALQLSASSLGLAVVPLITSTVMMVAATVVAVLPARSFKEGQQRASWVLIGGIGAAFYAQRSAEALDLMGALNPLTSPMMVLRDAVRGTLSAAPAFTAAAMQLAVAMILLAWAARKLRDETYLLGGPAAGREKAEHPAPEEDAR